MSDKAFGTMISELIAAATVVDLTAPLAETLPCTWPGHMPFRATVSAWFADRPDDPQPVHSRDDDGYQTRWLVLDEHTGTHMDAPRHFIPPADSGLPNAGPGGAVGIDALPVLAGSGPACVIDVSQLIDTSPPGTSPPITPEHISRWEQDHGEIGPGEVVLLRSCWDDRYRPGSAGSAYGSDVLTTRTRPGWPAPSPDAVTALADRGVRCVGTDGFSIGPAEDPGATHVAGLSRGMVFVEALCNLDRLPARGAWFLFLPIRIVDGTGGPGRGIAVLPASEAAGSEPQ